MLYSFKWTDDEGGEFDLDFPFGEAPDTVEHEGRPAKRVIRWTGSVKLRGAGWSRHPDREIADLRVGPQDKRRVAESGNV
jgi:hypothetical protein